MPNERQISADDPCRARPVVSGGDAYGTHRVIAPAGGLPQPAWRLDNDLSRLFSGETLLSVDTLNLDASSFAQIEGSAREALAAANAGIDHVVAGGPSPVTGGGPSANGPRPAGASGVEGKTERGELDDAIAHIVLRTVAERGKQHNPVTGSGGMLVGRVLQVAVEAGDALRPPPEGPIASNAGEGALAVGDRVATLASLTLTPLRIDRVLAIRAASAQIDVEGEAVLFASAPRAVLPPDIPARLALAVLDVAGAAPQVARLVFPGNVVVVLGAGGKSGVLCAAEARRRAGASGCLVGIEAMARPAGELRALGFCDAVIMADARDPVGVRNAVLAATGGREADVAFSCVNMADAEMAAILCTRDRGTAYFFAMSTSFTKAALGAEGVGKDVDLWIGNGYAHGHAEHTLEMLRAMPALRALFEQRYG